MILALSVFLCSASGTITPVWGQFDFGDDDAEESSDEESTDDGGFSLGDDDDEEDSDSGDDEDSEMDEDSGDSLDSDDSDDLDEDGESADISGDDVEVEEDEGGIFSGKESKNAKDSGKSAAKSNVVPFASNGSKAGEEAVLKFHGVEYRFRWCPAGTFLMGSPTKEVGRKVNEKQMEAVVPHGFWMLETEVTMQMFASFVRETGYKTDAERDQAGAYHVDVP
ncbi:MAG: SUMF1/EgtB/PvdO family nonheme iron enzyme, partial [Thermoguttaceae bacterium]|nr:SUMF1/EgtB/PvdO family nonheme iron enzyme [Thermoguttaceae bacterium]